MNRQIDVQHSECGMLWGEWEQAWDGYQVQPLLCGRRDSPTGWQERATQVTIRGRASGQRGEPVLSPLAQRRPFRAFGDQKGSQSDWGLVGNEQSG